MTCISIYLQGARDKCALHSVRSILCLVLNVNDVLELTLSLSVRMLSASLSCFYSRRVSTICVWVSSAKGPDEDMHTPRVTAVLAQRLRLDPVRPEYHRVTLEWRHTVRDVHFFFLVIFRSFEKMNE